MRRGGGVVAILGAVLLGASSIAPVAHADDPLPLYRLVDTAAQRLLTADPVSASKWTSCLLSERWR